jgi:uncharacterized membrane protein YhaH (DUF805 family)
MRWYLKALRNYTVYKGRSCRKEFWMFVFFDFIVSLGLEQIDIFRGIPTHSILSAELAYNLCTLSPALCLTIRRLHDAGRSGYWLIGFVILEFALLLLLIILVKYLGLKYDEIYIYIIVLIPSLMLLAFLIQDGEPGSNHYGFNPKEIKENGYELTTG